MADVKYYRTQGSKTNEYNLFQIFIAYIKFTWKKKLWKKEMGGTNPFSFLSLPISSFFHILAIGIYIFVNIPYN